MKLLECPRSARLLALALAATIPTAAQPCMCVDAAGGKTVFAGQTNIIVWNASTHTEHFIRNAQFFSTNKNFGFLAPTPSIPTLATAKAEAFTLLSALKPKPSWIDSGPYSASKSSVAVIRVQDVGGYRATILKASDPAALADWLHKNGYQGGPQVANWSKPYVDRDWYITAFKVQNLARVSQTGAVRMTFHTDKPFNPYRTVVSPSNRNQGSGLRIFFVSAGAFDPYLVSPDGRAQPNPMTQPEWTAGMEVKTCEALASALGISLSDLPKSPMVSEFFDGSFPNGSLDDLVFLPQPTALQTSWPWILAALATGGGLQLARCRRRKLPQRV